MRLGEVTIARIEDQLEPRNPPKVMFPNFRDDIWEAERHWLVPKYFVADGSRIRTSNHSWLINTGGRIVLIDTCIGNHKNRPQSPHHHMRQVPWLERLAAAGVRPEQVDCVFCTHLHADHVGWNTRLRDGRWVPTFPNAQYLFGREESARWDSRRADYQALRFNDFVFDDSILPIAESGQMTLVDDGYAVDESLVVESSPGHTRGHASVRLRSGGREAVFCGDILHHPVQIPYPELWCSFDDDPERALKTRKDLLDASVDRDVWLMPTHFAEPHCCRVVSDGARMGIDWITA